MEKEGGNTELRRWAVEMACRSLSPASLMDVLLVCQIADLLVAYVLTGSPILEPPPTLM